MSGYIINPFSSDFNPTTSISFSSESIPIAAYGLIGLTSLTLAYVTLVASSQGGSKASPMGSASATSMLPAMFSPKTPQSPSMAISTLGSPSPVTASAPRTPMAATPSKSNKPKVACKITTAIIFGLSEAGRTFKALNRIGCGLFLVFCIVI